MADYNSLYTGAQIDAGVGKANTAVQPAQIANFETTTQLNTRDTNNRDRANHTGTQASTTISDFSSAVTAVVNGLGLSAAFDSAAAILLIDSAYVQARQSLAGLGGLDSALTIQLIDSAYVQSRQDFAYASLTGKPLILDSDLIVQLIDSDYVALRAPASGLDSALAIQLIDSAYVQARQDFAYSSLTGTPTTLDSALTIQLIDSNYVQARQDFAYASLTGTPTLLDSALITQLIDSAYVALRTPAAAASLDSALTRSIFSGGTGVSYDSATGQFSIGQAVGTSDSVTFGGLRVVGDLIVQGTTTTVNTETINLADNVILVNSNATGSPTENGGVEVERGDATNVSLLWNETSDRWTFTNDGTNYHNLLIGGEYLDSALVVQLIDSAYIQLRQSSVGTGGVDSATVLSLIDSAHVQARQTPQDFAYASLTGAPNVLDSADVALIAGSISGLDSTGVRTLVDSAYVQARQDFAYASLTGAPSILDSALVTQLIDSAYIQLRETPQDFAYSSLTGAPNVLDSADVSAIAGGLSGLDSAGVRTLLADSSFTIDGDGTNSGVIISDGSVEIKTSTGSPAFADFYCEVGNAHRTRVKSAPHAQYSGNVDVTLPVTTGTLALISDITLDSAAVISLIDSAYVQLRQSTVGTGGLDSALVTQLIDSAYVQLRQDFAYSSLTGTPALIDSALVTQLIDSAYVALRAPAASGGIDSAAANDLIDAKIQIISIADVVGANGNTGEYLKSLGNGNAEWTNITTVIDSAYIQLRQSSVGSGGLDSALVTQLIDSAYIQLRQVDVFRDSAFITGLIDSAYVQLRQDFAYSSLTGAPNVLDSADVSLIAGGLSGLDSTGVINLVDSAYVQLRQDFAYSSLIGAPSLLDSALVTQLIDSAYVALRAPAAAGGVDSAAANTLIDAKIQVLDIADIVGSTGNPGEYLKSLGNGNASWENVSAVVDSAYVAARVGTTLATWQKISANYTLSAGDRIAVNTDSAWTMTLPASPTFSDEVYIIDATGNAATKNITVSGNSQKILASDSDLVINVNRASVAMMFYGDSQGWILTSAF